jgi:hypothetical protein
LQYPPEEANSLWDWTMYGTGRACLQVHWLRLCDDK